LGILYQEVTMRMKLLFLMILCLFCSLQAETYHVAVNASQAGDNNDGLSPVYVSGNRGPWKTIGNGVQNIAPGDTLLVYTGDYRNENNGWGTGVIPIQRSGQNNAMRLFIRAAAGQKPLARTFLIDNAGWIEIRGFTLTNPDFTLPANWKDMPMVVVDVPSIFIDKEEDWSTREAKVRQKFSTYMGIIDYFETTWPSGFDLRRASNVRIVSNVVSLYCFGINIRDISENILIDSNEIFRCNNAVFTWTPEPGLRNSTLRHNYVHHNFSNGFDIRVGSHNNSIEHNIFEYVGMSHIATHSGAHHNHIRYNIARFGGYYDRTMEYPGASSINIHTSGPGNIVEGNFSAYQQDSIGYDGNGFTADIMDPGAFVTFINNVAYRNSGYGITLTLSPNTVIINNNLIENGFNTFYSRAGSGVNFSRDADTGNIVVNNIFYNNATAGIHGYMIIDKQQRIDNNLYYSQDSKPFIWNGYNFGDREYYNLSSIRKDFSWELNGKAGNPLFAGEASLDFHLLSGSPAISGADIARAPQLDRDGKTRDAQPDIGAYEYSGISGVKTGIPAGIGAWPVDARFTVYDIRGRVVRQFQQEYHGSANNARLEDTFRLLPSGIYICRITGGRINVDVKRVMMK